MTPGYEPPQVEPTLVDEWPPPVRWLNYPVKLDEGVLGQVVGPMHLSKQQAKVHLTIVAVDGKRAGLAYGLYALREKP